MTKSEKILHEVTKTLEALNISMTSPTYEECRGRMQQIIVTGLLDGNLTEKRKRKEN